MSNAPSGMTADTGMSATNDTSRSGDAGMKTDTGSASTKSEAPPNQTESGVTDSSGKSTLGKEAGKTRPDQGQPVTSKGDTINPGVDSSAR
jgi:hypothetical protein